MKALWIENRCLTYRNDIPEPQPAPSEALIRVRLAGICGTDLELLRGYYEFTGIPGHEFVGEVISLGEGEINEWSGRRVVGEINIPCGGCSMCLKGYPTHCEQRMVLGIRGHPGAFAEALVLPVRNLHRVPEGVSDLAAVFTEPLAAALEIQEQVKVRPSDQVLVVGAGRLGLLAAQTLALTGCKLQVAARHPLQQRILGDWGISWIEEGEIAERGFDIVVEASGSPDGFALARRAVRPRGTLVLKSTYHGELTANFSSLVVDEVTLVGSRCGPFEPALRLMKTGLIDPRPLIQGVYEFEDGQKAFEQAARPGGLKIILLPEANAR
jgi:threonine dehydrogenase-like Zn-dependent dehydrogenase